MKSLLIQTFCLLFLCLGTVRAQQYQLASPNGKLSVTVDAGEALTWQIAHDGTTVLNPLPSPCKAEMKNQPRKQ